MGGRGRERYRALVERAPVGFFEMDAEFHCVYVNERWSEITGVPRQTALGDGWSAGLHPDDADAIAHEFARALEAVDDFRVEHRWLHPDGTIRWVLNLAQVTRDGDTVTGFAGTLTDITSEHYAEERLDALVAHSSDAIVVIGPDASIQFASLTMTRILGWANDELVGSMGLELLHPDDLEAAITTLTALVTQGPGTQETLSYRVHHKDGRWIPVEVVGINLLDDPAVEGIVLNVRDITERVETDRLLAESRERYRQIVETADEGIWTVDPSATTQFVNQRMADMLGYTVEEMTGASCFEFMDDVARVAAEEHLERCRTGDSQHAELKLRHRSGDDVWIRASAAPTMSPDGEYEGATALVTDVTAQREIEAQLRYNESRLSALFEASSDIMAVLELSGHWHASPAGTRILGYPMGYDPPGGLMSIVHPDDLELAAQGMQEVIDKTRSKHEPIRLRVRHIDGHYRWFDCTAENRVDDPTVGGLVIIARDVTEQKEAEDARVEAETQFRAAFERSPLGIAMIDLAGSFIAVNPAFTRILGRDDDGLIGASGLDLVHADDRDRIVTAGTDRAVGRSDAVPEPIRMLHPDGHEIWVMADVSLVPHPDGSPAYLLALIADVSDRKRLEQDLEYQAFHDPLTQLANRARMRTLLDSAWRERGARGGRLAVLFVDLDRFKGVNDTLGHDAGDELLILAAERLKSSVRGSDTVARFGGDEFVVICEGVIDRAEAVQIAGRIRESLAHPYQLKAAPAEIAASVGVAVDDGHMTVDDLLRDADMAAYRAKELGRNRVEVVGRAVGF